LSRLDIRTDTLTNFSTSPLINYRNTLSVSDNNNASRDSAGTLINEVTSDNSAASTNQEITINTYSNRRLKAKGSSIGLVLNFNNKNESDNDFRSFQEVFGNNPQTEAQDQFIQQEDISNTLTVSPSLLLPLAENWFIKTSYNFVITNQTNNRSDFDKDFANLQGVFNTALSTAFDLKTTENIPTVGFSFNNDKLRFDLGAGVNFQTL
jgi:hypothetical protein